MAKYHISEGRASSEFSLAREHPKMRLFCSLMGVNVGWAPASLLLGAVRVGEVAWSGFIVRRALQHCPLVHAGSPARRDHMAPPKVKRSIRLVLALYLMHKQCDLQGCNCIVRAKEQACAFSADSWQGKRHVVRKERGKANKITANAQRSAGVLLA